MGWEKTSLSKRAARELVQWPHGLSCPSWGCLAHLPGVRSVSLILPTCFPIPPPRSEHFWPAAFFAEPSSLRVIPWTVHCQVRWGRNWILCIWWEAIVDSDIHLKIHKYLENLTLVTKHLKPHVCLCELLLPALRQLPEHSVLWAWQRDIDRGTEQKNTSVSVPWKLLEKRNQCLPNSTGSRVFSQLPTLLKSWKVTPAYW